MQNYPSLEKVAAFFPLQSRMTCFMYLSGCMRIVGKIMISILITPVLQKVGSVKVRSFRLIIIVIALQTLPAYYLIGSMLSFLQLC